MEYPLELRSKRSEKRAAAGQLLKSIVTGKLTEPPPIIVPKFGAGGSGETTGADKQAAPAV
jgi:hypothetical protein